MVWKKISKHIKKLQDFFLIPIVEVSTEDLHYWERLTSAETQIYWE